MRRSLDSASVRAAPKGVPRAALVVSSLLACAALPFACRSTSEPPRKPRAPLMSGVTELAQYVSPARFRYHPREPAELLARARADEKQLVYAGERGERWLVDESSGKLAAATRLAPEALIGVQRPREGGWVFVGESGTGYEASTPLGPLIRASGPLEPLVVVSASEQTLVGINQGGRLLTSEDAGGSWRKVGPERVRFVDVELAEKGLGVALGIPEVLYWTEDAGLTWKHMDRPTIGALSLERDQRAGLIVESALGDYQLSSDAQLSRAQGARAPFRYELEHPPPRGPDADALLDGRADLSGTRYLELTSEKPGSFSLLSGPFDGELEAAPVAELDGCVIARLFAFGRFLYVACSKDRALPTPQRFEIYRSADAGLRWAREDYPVRALAGELQLAVGHHGALLVTGICPPQEAEKGCVPRGVFYRRPARHQSDADAGAGVGDAEAGAAKPDAGSAGDVELAPAIVPSLRGAARALTFSIDGRTAYAIGRRTKNGAFAVFVSSDGGATFQAREIEQVPRTSDDRRDEPSLPSARRDVIAAAAEDGALSMVFHVEKRPLLVVADDQGRVVSVSEPPGETSTMGAVGNRGIALSSETRQVFETLDGGASWELLGRLPLSPCPDKGECSIPVACEVYGCVLGNRLTRIGWRGQQESERSLLSPVDFAAPAVFEPRFLTPINCTLEEAPWRVVAGMRNVPSAHEAAIGSTSWFAPAVDMDRAKVSMLLAGRGPRAIVQSATLFSEVQRPEEYALAVLNQVEGIAALRYVVPESNGTGRLSQVEVAWSNLFEDRVGRARLPDGGAYSPGDYLKTESRAQRARPALVSIGAGGVYVRLHFAAGDRQPSYFLDGRNVIAVPGVTWPAVPKGARSEMAHVGSDHVPVLLVREGAAVVRARQSGSGYVFDALTAGLPEPRRFGLAQVQGIAYFGNRSGIHVHTQDMVGESAEGKLFPFRATGEVLDTPIRVPVQLDADPTPRRCTDQEKRTTPRVVVPYQPGTRHPITITDAVEPLRLLMTDRAVMHGTPQSACVAAFDAEPVELNGAIEGARITSAIIALDDLEHAWAFRAIEQGGGRVETRNMKCHFDPNLEVPPEAQLVPGARVRRRR